MCSRFVVPLHKILMFMDRNDTIKAAIRRHGITIAGIARELGMSPQNLGQQLGGNVGLSLLSKVSNVTGIPISEMLGEQEPEGMPQKVDDARTVGVIYDMGKVHVINSREDAARALSQVGGNSSVLDGLRSIFLDATKATASGAEYNYLEAIRNLLRDSLGAENYAILTQEAAQVVIDSYVSQPR